MEWLPEQAGLCDPVAGEVSWYKHVMLNRTSGPSGPNASFFCIRLSPNGRDCRQLCDPTDVGWAEQLRGQRGRNTGVVRAAVEGWWNDLKRGHFIDVQTRVVTIQLQCKSNNIGIRNRMTMLFEFTSPGGVLPSYDMETMVADDGRLTNMLRFMNVALAMCGFFVVLEGVELFSSGPSEYFGDLWNLMDWLNFLVFFQVWWTLSQMISMFNGGDPQPPCTELCRTVGYVDLWELMGTSRDVKTYLSICVCIQLLKIIKFTNVLIPKMGLMTGVLSAGKMDLLFFGSAARQKCPGSQQPTRQPTAPTARLLARGCPPGLRDEVPPRLGAEEGLLHGVRYGACPGSPMPAAFDRAGIVFGLSMFAFSNLFYIQLGAVMPDFNDQVASFLSLARALFGDFDIDDIMNNSSGYTNAVLFLVYLFVAVFILLSMFLAILGESQAQVRMRDEDAVETGTAPPEYGFLFHAKEMFYDWLYEGQRRIQGRGESFKGGKPRDRRLSIATDRALGYFLKSLLSNKPEEEEDGDEKKAHGSSEGKRMEEEVTALRESFDGSLEEIRSAISAISQQLEALRPADAPAGTVSEVMRRFDDKINRKITRLDEALLRRASDGTRWGQAAGAAGEIVRHHRRRKTTTGVADVAAAAAAAAAADARPGGLGGAKLANCARGPF